MSRTEKYLQVEVALRENLTQEFRWVLNFGFFADTVRFFLMKQTFDRTKMSLFWQIRIFESHQSPCD